MQNKNYKVSQSQLTFIKLRIHAGNIIFIFLFPAFLKYYQDIYLFIANELYPFKLFLIKISAGHSLNYPTKITLTACNQPIPHSN